MTIPASTRSWLLGSGVPYVRYQAQRLLEPGTADPSLLDGDPFIAENLRLIGGWRDDVVERHDKPGLFFHRLAMLADLGVTRDTRGAGPVVDSLLEHFAPDGAFLTVIRVPKAFGGSGEARPDWVICDFPVVLYALLRMAPGEPILDTAASRLESLVGEAFYPCCGSIPKFKGPGPRGGLCPYANLLAARALAAHPDGRRSEAARRAADALLGLWPLRKEKKPFLFAMGTDFLKLKFPMVWYNLLHVVSVLGGLPGVADDPRFAELAALLGAKLDGEGRARCESAYMIYKAEEWSDKKAPSRLMTALVHRTLDAARAAPDA